MPSPVAQTFALGQRDAAQATAQTLSNLSINQPSAPPTPRKSNDINPNHPAKSHKLPISNELDDEISRAQAQARLQAFMSYKGGEDEDEEEFLDDGWSMEEEGGYQGVEVGNEGRGDGTAVKRAKGTGEEMDEFGEDDEEWAEGNDDYMDRIR